MSAPPPSHDLDEVAPIPILAGPGEQLLAAREAAGMSVHEIATHMHLDSRVILALEADDYEQLPAPTFIRGYLRGYARLLDLPPEPIIQAFEQRDFAPPSLVADISVRSQVRSGDFPFRIVTYLVVAALVLLVVLWWRSQDFDPVQFDVTPGGEPEESEAESAMPVDDGTAPEPELPLPSGGSEAPEAEAEAPVGGTGAAEPEATAGGEAGEPEAEAEPVPPTDGAASAADGQEPAGEPPMPEPEAADSESDEEPEAAAQSAGAGGESSSDPDEGPPAEAAAEAEPETGAEDVAVLPEASAEEIASEAPPVPSADLSSSTLEAEEETLPGAGAPADRLEMSFVVECWLEVYDHADEQLFYGLAQPGEHLSLSGRGPIRLVLGNAEDLEVSYNGTPIDFSAFSARGVARFSVGGEPPIAFETPSATDSAGAPATQSSGTSESTGN